MSEKSDKPLILVTNDDGIKAKGIRSLIEVAKEFGEVWVVAPDGPQSGMGHAITVHNILRMEEVKDVVGVREFTTTGTPVDCVKIAINRVLARRPDLLVSGINHGANHSTNILYSGTMSAAVEGAMEGIPSVGFSLLDHSPEADFTGSQAVARTVIKMMLEKGIPHHTCLNVNIPAVSPDQLKGLRICRQAYARWEDYFEPRVDPQGRMYYWVTGEFKDHDVADDTDVWALKHNYVSVVPVQFDLTAHAAFKHFESWNGKT